MASTHTKRVLLVIGIMLVGTAIVYCGLALENWPVQVSGGLFGLAVAIYIRFSNARQDDW